VDASFEETKHLRMLLPLALPRSHEVKAAGMVKFLYFRVRQLHDKSRHVTGTLLVSRSRNEGCSFPLQFFTVFFESVRLEVNASNKN
jgi:hypothetical protein